MGARILVAEADAKQSRLIRVYLEREGNAVQVVADGRPALERARSVGPDLIVLDVMLPLVDGLDVCRILRAESDVPILLLTARTTEEDMVLGLDLGADDYLTKPYSPRELTARVRALLRRSKRAAEPAVLRAGEVELDTARFEVRVDTSRTRAALPRTRRRRPRRSVRPPYSHHHRGPWAPSRPRHHRPHTPPPRTPPRRPPQPPEAAPPAWFLPLSGPTPSTTAKGRPTVGRSG
ncbi:response regulator transcription factor [Streptomyces sp. NPDC018693]|uniref:response regulator transcription factor n=1 Tax=unclassified Streptomyces TaxID=2593676 RepID=UPI0037A86E97